MGFGSLGIQEMLVIGLLVLVVFGPRRLPEIARSMGKALREFKRGVNEIQRELEEAERGARVREPPPSRDRVADSRPPDADSRPPDTDSRPPPADPPSIGDPRTSGGDRASDSPSGPAERTRRSGDGPPAGEDPTDSEEPGRGQAELFD